MARQFLRQGLQSRVKAEPAFLEAGTHNSSGGVLQHKLYAFGRQPMPIPDALIVGLGIGQAEFGLVEK
jgi:hypothetical protein